MNVFLWGLFKQSELFRCSEVEDMLLSVKEV